MPDTITLELVPWNSNKDTKTIPESKIRSLNPVKAATAQSDLKGTIVYDCEVLAYCKRQDRLNVKVNGTTEWTGVLLNPTGRRTEGTLQIQAAGLGKLLEESRPDTPVAYTNEALGDAIEDYWSRTQFSASVTKQSPSVVKQDEQLQAADTTSEWQNITSIPSDVPITAQNGNLELSQTCFTVEGEAYDRGDISKVDGVEPSSPGDYSGGDWASLVDDGTNTAGQDFIEHDFSVKHNIPGSDFGVQVRDGTDPEDGGPAIQWTLLHADGSEYLIDEINNVGFTKSVSWSDIGSGLYDNLDGYTGPDLTPGDYTLRVDVTDSGGSLTHGYFVDVVAPYDDRYSYTFDDDNGGSSGYLDGPELYPRSETTTTSTVATSLNIDSLSINSTWTDTSNSQRLGVSNTDGSSWLRESNTATTTQDFSTAGRQAKSEFRLGRYGTRTTATPQTGYQGQAIQDYTLTADLDDLTVIDELTLTRDHYSNLQELFNYGEYENVIEHSAAALGNLTVKSFPRGALQKALPANAEVREGESININAQGYYNKVYVEGAQAKQGDPSSRPTATAQDDTAISEDGRVIERSVRDQNIVTEAGAKFRADAILDVAQANGDVLGEVEIAPSFAEPGYSRPVSFFDQAEEYRFVERVSLQLSPGSVSGRMVFSRPQGLGRSLSDVRRDGESRGNRV